MQVIVFDIDHTIFDANQVLRDGVVDLFKILKNLGLKIGAISNQDHRALVRLDEAGVRSYFSEVMCSAHSDSPKSAASLQALLNKLDAETQQTALVSHAHADILLGKEVMLSKTIGVSHGTKNIAPLYEAGADHIVANIPAVLDVLN
jgi:phosphoglycolate phosphatase-like HAD superfamily hydrolase